MNRRRSAYAVLTALPFVIGPACSGEGGTDPAPTPFALEITTQPAGAVSGAAFAVQPVVTVRDARGNTVTTATLAVTAALGSGTGSLGGTATVAAVAGVARFTDLSITGVGAHTLVFTAPGLSGVLSTGLSVGEAPSGSCRFILAEASAVFSPGDFCAQGGVEVLRIVVPARPGSLGALIAVAADIPSFDHVQGVGDQDAAFTVKAAGTSDTTTGTRRSRPVIQRMPLRQLPAGYEVAPTGIPQTRTFCNDDWCVEAALAYNGGAWAFYEDLNLQASARAGASFYSAVVQKMEASDSLLFRLFGQMTDVDGDRSIAVLATDSVPLGTFFWNDAFGPGPPESSGPRRSTFERLVTFGPGLLIASSGSAYTTAYWSTNVTAEAAEILTNTHAARLGIAPTGCCWSGGFSNYESHLGNGSSYLVPYIVTDGVPDGGLESFWSRSCFAGSTPFDCSLRNDIYFGSGAFWYWLHQRFGPGIVAEYMDSRWQQQSGDRLEWTTGTPESVLYPQFLLSLALDGTAAGAAAELDFPTSDIRTRLPGLAASLQTLAVGSPEGGTAVYTRSWVRDVSSTMATELEVQWVANRKLRVVVAQQ